MTNGPIILIDGSSYLFRAYHVAPLSTTSTGKPNGCIKVIGSMFRGMSNLFPESPIAIVFDARGKNFRHDLYPDYKANRPPVPMDIKAQIAPVHSLVRAMGFPLFMVAGVEADDVIGTLATAAANDGESVIISTGDKDFAQLVSERVTLLDTMTGKKTDIPAVIEKFGVRPSQIIDFLALTGDKVDNIPGIPGVGAKTAAAWLNQYGDLRGITANASQIKGKIGEKLRANFGPAVMSKRLATIRTDIELSIGWRDLRPPVPDAAALESLFAEYEIGATNHTAGEMPPAFPESAF